MKKLIEQYIFQLTEAFDNEAAMGIERLAMH